MLVYRPTGLINFAQGGMAVAATFVAYALTRAGVPVLVALLAAVVAGFVLGALLERG